MVDGLSQVGLTGGAGDLERYPLLELSAEDISDIEIVQDHPTAPSSPPPPAIGRPPARDLPRPRQAGRSSDRGAAAAAAALPEPDEGRRGHGSNGSTPRKGGGSGNRHSLGAASEWSRDDVRRYKDEDFDFQANLNLFNKAKIFSEIQAQDSTRPEDRLVAHNLSQRKLRHDQNVLERPRHKGGDLDDVVLGAQALSLRSSPTAPAPPSAAGETVPCVTAEAVRAIEQDILSSGLVVFEQIVENAGRSLCSLILEGGGGGDSGTRAMPDTVLVLATPERLGCFALCAGRHLLNRGIQVDAVVVVDSSSGEGGRARPSAPIDAQFAQALEQFNWYGGRILDRPRSGGGANALLLACVDLSRVPRAMVTPPPATAYCLVPSRTGEGAVHVRFGLAHDLVPGTEHTVCDLGWPAALVEERLQLAPGRYAAIFGRAFYTAIREQ